MGIGRDGLDDFYTLRGRSEASVLRAKSDSVHALNERLSAALPVRATTNTRDAAVIRADIARAVEDRSLLRGVRFELLQSLMVAPCTNARELVFGPNEDLVRVFEIARRELARFPGEEALLEVARTTAERGVSEPVEGFLPRLVYRLSRLAGLLLANKRLSGCTELFLTNIFAAPS